MRHALTSALLFSLSCGSAGQAGDTPELPTAPLPPGPGPLTQIWGKVVDASGLCIDSASVRVVEGQALDRSARQETPCDLWEPGGGFFLTDLVAGVPLTIRATAPGYLSLDRIVTPASGPLTVLVLSPPKAGNALANSR